MTDIEPVIVVKRGVALERQPGWGVMDRSDGSHVYVMGPIGAPWCKVGISRQVIGRMQVFMAESESENMALWAMFPLKNFHVVERLAHLKLREHRIVGERFSVHPSVAIQVVKEIIAAEPTASPRRVGWNKERPASCSSETQSWTIRSVPNSTREMATKAAYREGVTVSQWLDARVRQHVAAGAQPVTPSPLKATDGLTDLVNAAVSVARVAPGAENDRLLKAAMAEVHRMLRSFG